MLVFFKELTTLSCGWGLFSLPFSPFLVLLTKDIFAFYFAVLSADPKPSRITPFTLKDLSYFPKPRQFPP